MLCPVEFSFSIVPDPKRRCIDQDHADLVPAQIRTGGWMISWVPRRPTPPGLHVFNYRQAQVHFEVLWTCTPSLFSPKQEQEEQEEQEEQDVEFPVHETVT